MNDWLHATPTALGGKRIHRLGLATNYGIDADGVRHAMDRGLNVFVWTSRGKKGLASPLREAIAKKRDDVVVIGFAAVGLFGWSVRRACESLLKELGTDHLDVLLLGWLGVGSAWTDATQNALRQLKESGKARAIGTSIHDRVRAGTLAEQRALDLLMIRYNAAHPGAERDIFPHVHDHSPSVLAYTATSWRRLLKKPRSWDGAPMTAGDCYRFQLSSPHVDFALTGPATRAQLDENLDALEAKGPLTKEEDETFRAFGKAVHG